jgi:hypothetical protein
MTIAKSIADRYVKTALVAKGKGLGLRPNTESWLQALQAGQRLIAQPLDLR